MVHHRREALRLQPKLLRAPCDVAPIVVLVVYKPRKAIPSYRLPGPGLTSGYRRARTVMQLQLTPHGPGEGGRGRVSRRDRPVCPSFVSLKFGDRRNTHHADTPHLHTNHKRAVVEQFGGPVRRLRSGNAGFQMYRESFLSSTGCAVHLADKTKVSKKEFARISSNGVR